MDSIDESPDQPKPSNTPAKRRLGGLVYMLVGLGILAYCVPEISAGIRERGVAMKRIKSFDRLEDEPSDARLAEDPFYYGSIPWKTYKAARTRVRVAGLMAFIGGMSLTGGISFFLRANPRHEVN